MLKVRRATKNDFLHQKKNGGGVVVMVEMVAQSKIKLFASVQMSRSNKK